jgi:hypothetical protein
MVCTQNHLLTTYALRVARAWYTRSGESIYLPTPPPTPDGSDACMQMTQGVDYTVSPQNAVGRTWVY